jgi:hypothetical protein
MAPTAIETLRGLLPTTQDLWRVTPPPTTESSFDYVDPPLRVLRSSERPKLVLVSAPAAVGKSRLTEELQRVLGVQVVDLAGNTVAKDSFAGQLAGIFGEDSLGDATRALGEGDLVLAVDALDEALVASGYEPFVDYIQDVVDRLERADPDRASVVLLGRPETIDETMMIVELHAPGLPFLHVGIDFFEKADGRTYVEKLLDHLYSGKKERPPHIVHPASFDRAYELVWGQLNAAVVDDEDGSRAFLGYAPVLTAVAELLAVNNPLEVAGQFSEADETAYRTLLHIADEIVRREEGKVDKAYATVSGYYSADVQSRLLLQVPVASHVDIPEGLPESDREAFKAGIERWAYDHPFIVRDQTSPQLARRFASVVFRDYVLARNLLSSTDADVDAARALCSESAYQPSPMLARFLFHIGADADDGARVDARWFDVVLGSLMTGVGGEDASVRIEPDPTSLTEVDDDVLYDRMILTAQLGGASIEFELIDVDVYPLALGGYVRRLSLYHPSGTVELREGPLFLGPGVDVEADRVVVHAGDLVVRGANTGEGSQGDNGVEISVGVLRDPAGTRLRVHGDLVISTDAELRWPWRDYAGHRASRASTEGLVSAGKDLRKLANWFFRGHGMRLNKSTVAVLVAKNRLNGDMVDYAVARGLLTDAGIDWHLDLEGSRVERHAIDGVDLSHTGLAAFLKGYQEAASANR